MIELRTFTHTDLPTIRQTLIDIHAHIPEYPADDEFAQRFPWFVDHWGKNPGFVCVMGYDGPTPVGYAYGAPLTEGREWWRGQLDPVPEKTVTFAVSELMVLPRWRKTGTAERLHATLLHGRPEALAVLLVDTTHPKVQSAYEEWGYSKVGEQQPFPDSPVYAVMLRPLPA
ncbi:GNAT family N-acetyltransferase [Streptomyces sp. A0592]|uniref:GNAT family N-acetyltransferase n=1 Tax=Streptomyces sp. A0592 TaxID=2563099 RepID=UPI001F0DD4DF|nr:GNAT family N-acetyltransferase [Streptomyces sp. A0592]